ncbi:dynein regulatory complex protein 1-like [Lissotriton helveticus]
MASTGPEDWQETYEPPPAPTTDSEDQQERLLARRIRVAERQEAKRREALGEDPNAKEEVKEAPRRSHKQIEDSQQRLGKLVKNGTLLVTNVRVAASCRETQRRAEEDELKRQRFEKLDSEAKASLEMFEDISNKLIIARNKEIPQDIWEILNEQQQQCAQLIEEKNNLISELQQELKVKDEQYVKDLKKHAEDIDLLIERMEEQIRSLTKTYIEEFLQIEKSFELERRELLAANRNKWEKGMQARRDQELEYLLTRMRKVEEYEQQMRQLLEEDAEEYSIIKIKLETDVQILEQQLQQMKAAYQLNEEKLDYNFQVLKKRDDENIVTKSQQKRKITRMQDGLSKVRGRLDRQTKTFNEENRILAHDYARIVEQHKQLQKKIKHFGSVEPYKFRALWLMNEEEIKGLVRKALELDRIIYEQQLGLPWAPPDLWFMDNVGPLSQLQKKKKSASELAEEVIFGSEGSQTCVEEDSDLIESSLLIGGHQFSAKTVKRILEIISDESGFLIEKRLLKLLAPLEKNDRSLIKLDAIFKAMGIENEDEVYKLVDFFLKYRAEHLPSDLGEEEVKKILQETSESPSRKLEKSISDELIHPSDELRKSISGELIHPKDVPEQSISDELIHPQDVLQKSISDELIHPKDVPQQSISDELIHPKDVLQKSISDELIHPKVVLQKSISDELIHPKVVLQKSISDELIHPSDELRKSISGELIHPKDVPQQSISDELIHPKDVLQKSISDELIHPKVVLQKSISDELIHPKVVLQKSISDELIHLNDVLRALRDFVKDYRTQSVSSSQLKLPEVEGRDCIREARFWEAMANVIPESRLKEWDALEAAMFKYHNVLLARSQLLDETASLGQQNNELQLLLQQYLNSKINFELEVPPSQVLQLDSCPI